MVGTLWRTWGTVCPCRCFDLDSYLTEEFQVNSCGIPHLAKNERDAPNFLHAALDNAACAPFSEERRMKIAEPTKFHRKSGMWGTTGFVAGHRLDRLIGLIC
jgi:hypothetical protein